MPELAETGLETNGLAFILLCKIHNCYVMSKEREGALGQFRK